MIKAKNKLDELNYKKSIEEIEQQDVLKAIEINDLNFLNRAREAGFDFNQMLFMKNNTCLTVAVELNKIKIVEELLKPEYQIDINLLNEDGELNPILAAASYKRLDIMKLLIERGADVNCKNTYGFTPLILSVRNNSSKIYNLPTLDKELEEQYKKQKGIIELLLSKGAKKTINDGLTDIFNLNIGSTALIFASYYGNKEAVKILINNKADINLEDTEGNNAFLIAVKKRHVDIVKLFLELGVDPNLQNSIGETGLLVACEEGSYKTINTLLESKNININLSDRNGFTPLMVAAQTGNNFVLQKLLELGANVFLTCKDKYSGEESTALDLAKQHNFKDCIETLKNKITEIQLKNHLEKSLIEENKIIRKPKIM